MPAHTGKFCCCNYKRLCKFYAYPTVTSKIGGVITNCVLAWVHVISLSDSWNLCATDNVKLMQCLNYIVAMVFVVATVITAKSAILRCMKIVGCANAPRLISILTPLWLAILSRFNDDFISRAYIRNFFFSGREWKVRLACGIVFHKAGAKRRAGRFAATASSEKIFRTD